MKNSRLFKSLVLVTTIVLVVFGVSFTYIKIANGEEAEAYDLIYEKENYEYAKMEQEEGVLLSAYVLQDDFIEQSMENFNEITEKKHGSFFRYVGYGRPFPTEWVEEVKAVGAIPHIAFEPNDGLEVVEDDEYLREWARAANDAGVPIYIRWASEMNGTWTQYSGQSDLYIEKWRLVYDVFQEEAPNCSFVWTVFTFPESTIESFYPGDEYVDWVGVNIYSVVYHNNDLKQKCDFEDPLELLDYVYNTYSYKKPIQISEFGATHYSATDEETYSEWAAEKITRLYSNLETYYPRVKSIFYFDVNNLYTYNADRRVNDYSITDDEIVLNAYKEATTSEYFLSEYVENTVESGTETLTYNGFTTVIDDKTYVPVEYFQNYLGLEVEELGGVRYLVTRGDQAVEVKSKKWEQKMDFEVEREHIVLPLNETLESLGYTLVPNDVTKQILIQG